MLAATHGLKGVGHAKRQEHPASASQGADPHASSFGKAAAADRQLPRHTRLISYMWIGALGYSRLEQAMVCSWYLAALPIDLPMTGWHLVAISTTGSKLHEHALSSGKGFISP